MILVHIVCWYFLISETPMTTSVPPLEASLVTIMKQITSIMQISSRPSLKNICTNIAKFICRVFHKVHFSVIWLANKRNLKVLESPKKMNRITCSHRFSNIIFSVHLELLIRKTLLLFRVEQKPGFPSDLLSRSRSQNTSKSQNITELTMKNCCIITMKRTYNNILGQLFFKTEWLRSAKTSFFDFYIFLTLSNRKFNHQHIAPNLYFQEMVW